MMATNGPSARAECRWMKRASTSASARLAADHDRRVTGSDTRGDLDQFTRAQVPAIIAHFPLWRCGR